MPAAVPFGVYHMLLDVVRLLTVLGLSACVLSFLLLSRQEQPVLGGLRVLLVTVGVTLLVLLITDLTLVESVPLEWQTLFRRFVGRCILSFGACWFLYTCLRS